MPYPPALPPTSKNLFDDLLGRGVQATGGREDNLALLAKDVRELVEDLMEQVGSSTDAKAGLVELKDVAQKFKASTPANPRIGHKQPQQTKPHRIVHSLPHMITQIMLSTSTCFCCNSERAGQKAGVA